MSFDSAVRQLRRTKAKVEEDPPETITKQDEVLSEFSPIFQPDEIDNLGKNEFLRFLRSENNKHWTGLHRHGPRMTEDMDRLRAGLKVLVDEDRDLASRVTEAKEMVDGMGKGTLSAILLVAYPEKYGVWNNKSETALRKFEIFPEFEGGEKFGSRYASVNEVLHDLANEIEVDLWTLDSLFHYVLKFSEDESPGDKEAADDVSGPFAAEQNFHSEHERRNDSGANGSGASEPWTEAIEEELLRYRAHFKTDTVTLDEIYEFSVDRLAEKYPENENIQAKIRQQLQELRDDDKVEFVDNQGTYKILIGGEDLDLPALSNEIFELLDGTPDNSKEANDRVKQVTQALEEYLEEKPKFQNFLWSGVGQKAGSPYTSRPHKQPTPNRGVEYWKVCWIGLAHKVYKELYERPQDGLQLQFTVRSETDPARPPAYIALHLNANAPSDLRSEIRTNLNEDRDEFLSELRDLDDYKIGLGSEAWSVDRISANWGEFIDGLDNHFTIFDAISPEELDSLGSELVPEIASRFDELLPLYSLISGLQIDNGLGSPSVWIEKGRPTEWNYDEPGSDFGYGEALFTPRTDQGGSAIFESLRQPAIGDIVLHLSRESNQIIGISSIDSLLKTDFEPPADAGWSEDQLEEGGYLRELRDYAELSDPVNIREDVLENPQYKELLREIAESNTDVFFTPSLNFASQRYLTKSPSRLISILAMESEDLGDRLAERGYELERPPNAGEYESVSAAVEDVRQRLLLPIAEGDQLADRITESVLSEWTHMLSGFEPNCEISRADEVRGKQIIGLYEDLEGWIRNQAILLGVGTLDVLDEAESLFVILIRDLQDRFGLTTNFNQVKFNVLKNEAYSVTPDDPIRRWPEGEPLEPAPQPRNGDELRDLLMETGQLVFYGPPGTGKTYTAQQFARWWLTESTEDPTSDQLETVTFHPSFSYEDFVEGLTARQTEDGSVSYEVESGAFKRIAERARDAYQENSENPHPFILIIDEINRGNLSQVFGELITTLEADKRLDAPNEVRVSLAHSRKSFTVPPNLYLIGTMNTADQSIALVDAALRRRFRFVHFPPDYKALSVAHGFAGINEARVTARDSDDPYQKLLALSIIAIRELNERIRTAPDLGKGKQIGHSFLWDVDSIDRIVRVWKFEILPLLEEYFFGQFDRIQEELLSGAGRRLFDYEHEEIRDFDADELAQDLATIVSLDESTLTPSLNQEGSSEDSEYLWTYKAALERGIIEVDDELVFNESLIPEASSREFDPQDPFWRCRVTGETGQRDNVEWLGGAENGLYSLSGLARQILRELGEDVDNVDGPRYWRVPERDNQVIRDLVKGGG